LVNVDANLALIAANNKRRLAAARLDEQVRFRVEQLVAIAPLRQMLPPVVTLISPSMIESTTGEVTLDYSVYTPNADAASGVEVRVDGRPFDQYKNDLPTKTDGKSIGRLRLTVPRRNVLVQLFVANQSGVSAPAVVAIVYLAPAEMLAQTKPAKPSTSTLVTTVAAEIKPSSASLQPQADISVSSQSLVQATSAQSVLTAPPAPVVNRLPPSQIAIRDPAIVSPPSAAQIISPSSPLIAAQVVAASGSLVMPALPVEIRPSPSPVAAPKPQLGQPVVVDKRPTLYLLAIGVSEYFKSEYDLAFAAKDAQDLSGVFKQQSGLFYKKVESRLLSNKLATRQSIIDGLNWLKTAATADDVGVLFLAGHGINVDDIYYFAPHDVDIAQLARTGVPEQHFRDALANMKGKAIFFVDTCFSGKSVGILKQSDLTKLANKLSSPENGVIVFSASHSRQESQEDPSWGNGAFTKALVAGLIGEADYRKEGLVTHRGLDYYVGYEVKKLTKNLQQPVTMVPVGLPDFGITKPLGRDARR
ncbi:MAG: caspase family protein, partial [Pseudomonadota bacterium]